MSESKKRATRNAPTSKGANVTGVLGSAMAAQIIKQAIAAGEMEAQFRVSRKERCVAMFEFSQEDHVALRSALAKRLDEAKDEAGFIAGKDGKRPEKNDKGQSWMDYRRANPVANSLSTEVPMWTRISIAIGGGAMSKEDLALPWDKFSQKCTDVTSATGKPGADGKTQVNPQQRSGRPRTEKTNTQKAVESLNRAFRDPKTKAVLDVNPTEVVKAMVKMPEAQSRGIDRVALVSSICEDATTQELDAIIEMLVATREARIKTLEAMHKARPGQTPGVPQTGVPASTPFTGPGTVHDTGPSKPESTASLKKRAKAVREGKPDPGPSKADALIEQGKEITRAAAKNSRRTAKA